MKWIIFILVYLVGGYILETFDKLKKKTVGGFVGCFVGMVVGFFFALLVIEPGPTCSERILLLVVICALVGIPLGRYIGGRIEEKEEQERKAAERQRREQYQREKRLREIEEERKEAERKKREEERMKAVRKKQAELARIRFEELFSPKYRAKEEEELARRKKDEEVHNLVNSLPACVESWRSHSNSSLKHIYFYDYYPYSKYKENASDGMWEAWRTVWHFKNDPSKNVSCFEHDRALRTITNLVEKALRSAFGTKTEYLTLVCLTASTQRKTELRYKEFADKVCKDLNMTNAYPHIRVFEDGSAKHDGGDGTRQVSYDNYFFKGKNIVLFDDVRTTGNSLEQERRTMEGFGAKVICAITIAQTIY